MEQHLVLRRYEWNSYLNYIMVPHNGISELEVAIELCQIVFIILCTIIIAKDRTISKFEEKNV